MKRAVLMIFGILGIVVSLPFVLFGAVAAALGSGDDPTIEGRIGQVDSSGYAVVSDMLEVHWEYPFADRFDLSVGVRSDRPDTAIFIGYGAAAAVDAYLSGVPQTLVYDLGPGSRAQREVQVPGSATPNPPQGQKFWIEQASGTGLQVIPFAPPVGNNRVVVMNADASRAVAAELYGSMRLAFLLPVGVGLLVVGVLLFAVSLLLLILGIRSKPTPAAVPAVPAGYGAPVPSVDPRSYPSGGQYGANSWPGGQAGPGSFGPGTPGPGGPGPGGPGPGSPGPENPGPGSGAAAGPPGPDDRGGPAG